MSVKQKTELCDVVGKFLIGEIGTESVNTKVEKLVTDYVKKNRLEVDQKELFNSLDWSVRVKLKTAGAHTHEGEFVQDIEREVGEDRAGG